MFTRSASILVLVLRTKVLVLGATVLDLVLVLPLLVLTTSLQVNVRKYSKILHCMYKMRLSAPQRQRNRKHN